MVGAILLEMGPEAKAYRQSVRSKEWNSAARAYGEIPVSAKRMRQRGDRAQRGRLGGDKAEDAKEVKTTVRALKQAKIHNFEDDRSAAQKKALAAHEKRERGIRSRRNSRYRQANDAARGPNAKVKDDDQEWEDKNPD